MNAAQNLLRPDKVMVADDDPGELFAVSRVLKKAGYVVEEARSGPDAIAAARTFMPDILLLDVVMPGMDGIEACRRIKADPELKHIFVVLMSSINTTPEYQARGLDAGADGFIARPFDTAEFLSRIRSILRIKNEKNHAEKGRAQAVRNWDAMFNAIGQMTFILDPHHGIEDVNDAALIKTGLSREELIGKKCFELVHGTRQPPDDCPMVKLLRSGHQETAPMVIEEFGGDFLISCTPILDAAGKVERVIHVATDISVLKKTENDLKENEEKYRMLFKSASDAIFLVDVETMALLDANEAASRLYGYGHEEFLKMKATDVSAETEKTIRVIQVDAATEIPVRYHRKKDGAVFPVEITANYFTFNGRKTNISSIRDISSRLKIEKEKREFDAHLRQMQKLEAIGTLAGGIAHDFNNILSSIIGFTELSLDAVSKDTELANYLQEVFAAGNRAKDLVKQILTFARKTDDNITPLQIGRIVKEAAKFLRASIPATIDIVTHIECDALVMADPVRIHQVLMNLCTNAAHAMDDAGGKLEIGLSLTELDESHVRLDPELKAGEYVKLTVSDTGSGIPAEIMGSIFEPYFTTKPPGEGTGLGLAMVHGIVKSCGGHIRVESEAGKGTLFTLFFPATAQTPVDKRYIAEALPGGNERILLVDDELPITRISTQMLEGLGYHVTALTSSVEALALFASSPDDFDLIITDMTMPEMTGDKLAMELLKIDPDIPIIACTGHSKKITDEQAAQIGIKALAFKPIVRTVLARTVRKVLDEGKKGK
ncbi:MAG: response regulator [Desulfobacteraceae bacterium]|nr:MAG: response regulator [Desulfobacteraceae bacterium]